MNFWVLIIALLLLWIILYNHNKEENYSENIANYECNSMQKIKVKEEIEICGRNMECYKYAKMLHCQLMLPNGTPFR